jgi:hypothetical protein
LRLFGVVAHDTHEELTLPSTVALLPFRDLGAVVGETAVARPGRGSDDIATHLRVVDSIFAQHSLLPAPIGVVFRTEAMVKRWLELHYVTLSDALGFVEGRVGARLYVSDRTVDGPITGPRVSMHTAEVVGDVEAIAAGSFRLLRRYAAASVVLRPPPGTQRAALAVAAAGFLVDRERWRAFADVVAEEARRAPDLDFRLSGPWPPYDFIRMQFSS